MSARVLAVRLGVPPLRIAVLALGALVALPVLAVLVRLFSPWGENWAHLVATVLGEYLALTAGLALAVGAVTAVLGTACAWLTTMCRFPLARFFEWALLLPLAVPAYVMAYVYTDFLQYTGPVQTALRRTFGWQGGDYAFPAIRSPGGAAFVLAFVLYPYVYVLARAAFAALPASAFDTARALGAGAWSAFFRVALPLARPGIAAGTALAVMEVLADYGAVAYFGVNTLATGIYRAWFSLGDLTLAAQLGSLLLFFVAAVLAAERLARGRAAFHATERRAIPRFRLRGLRAAAAFGCCALPFVAGFALPALLLLRLALDEDAALPWVRFVQAAGNSLVLAAAGALLTVGCALVLAYGARVHPGAASRALARLAASGYAVPGVVLAIGVMGPVALADRALAALGIGALLGGTAAALLYAYAVRFLAVALQSVEAGLARVRRAMEDAARSLGLRPAETLARVHAPLIAPSVLAALLLCFVDVMKELPATLALRPFDFDTLAVLAFNYAKDERLAEAALPSLAIVACGLAPVVLLARSMAR